MTLQEFANLHPTIFQYERAGVEGIDFQKLHNAIEKSRYLKSRQSFIFFTKNYDQILGGRYDDFKLEIEKDKPQYDEQTLKDIEFIKARLATLKALDFTPELTEICIHYTDLKPTELIDLLEKATKYAGYIIAAKFKYKEFAQAVLNVLGRKI